MKLLREKILLLAKVGCVAFVIATAIAVISCNDEGIIDLGDRRLHRNRKRYY